MKNNLLKTIKFIDDNPWPSPVLLQGHNSRNLPVGDKWIYSSPTLWSANKFTLVTRFHEPGDYTGGNLRLFETEADALTDALFQIISVSYTHLTLPTTPYV